MKTEHWYRAQRAYYDRRPHRHLLPGSGGFYAENIVDKLWRALGTDSQSHGIELGCGAGRFTLPLLARCARLEAVDLSSGQLDRLGEALRKTGVEPGRCTLHELNAGEGAGALPVDRYDFLVGVFFLHHLYNPTEALARWLPVLRPGGRVAFLEPNRLNPLFLIQIACCADMTWREERRLYRHGPRSLLAMLTRAGFVRCRVQRIGFFPPQVLNRFPQALEFEHRLEQWRWLNPVLPFLMVTAERAAP